MKYIQIVVIFFVSLKVDGQVKLINIDVGDSIPELVLNDVYDQPNSMINLGNTSKDKLVILDFWATWCGACLGAMPKLDSIATAYSEELIIITITKQSKKEVLEFLNKRKKGGHYVHRSGKIFGDTTLYKLFPHLFIPHYVWIKDGKVIAFTEEVTVEAVQSALLEGRTNLVKKEDQDLERFDREHTVLLELLKTDSNWNMNLMGDYALKTGFIKKFANSMGYNVINLDSIGKVRFTGVNMSLDNLFRIAYGKRQTYINDSAIEIKSNHGYFKGIGLKGMEFLAWLADFGVGYEVVVNKDVDIYNKMAEGLREAFPEFNAYLQNSQDTCLVLEVFNTNPEKQWKVEDDQEERYENDQYGIKISNGTVTGLMISLEYNIFLSSKLPLVNGLSYNGKVDLELNGAIYSLVGINDALRPYGLRIVKKMASYNKLIIDDRKIF